jgi:hypothetical protein
MRWFQSKHHKNRRDTDWDFFDGYPPNLRMRKLTDGAWEVRQATEEEMQEFMASEAAFLSRLTEPSRATLSPDDRFPGDVESDVSASDPAQPASAKKS